MPYIIKKSTLTGIADAIRGKTGGTDKMNPVEMASAIEGISAGGGASKLFITEVTPESQIKKSTTPLTITHDLGVMPQFVFVVRKEYRFANQEQSNEAIFAGVMLAKEDDSYRYYNGFCVVGKPSNGSLTCYTGLTAAVLKSQPFKEGYAGPLSYMDESTMKLCGCGNNSIPFLNEGTTYRVIAGAY